MDLELRTRNSVRRPHGGERDSYRVMQDHLHSTLLRVFDAIWSRHEEGRLNGSEGVGADADELLSRTFIIQTVEGSQMGLRTRVEAVVSSQIPSESIYAGSPPEVVAKTWRTFFGMTAYIRGR